MNAFIASKFVGEKSREKLIRHLEGCYMDLALSSHGSRALELLYGAANPTQKESIVKELSERVAQLNSKPWCVIINRKLAVDSYRKIPPPGGTGRRQRRSTTRSASCSTR